MRRTLLLVPLLLAAGCLEASSPGDEPAPASGTPAISSPASGTPAGPTPATLRPAITTPATATPTGANASTFRSLETGQDSESEAPARLVLRDRASWEAFYANHTKRILDASGSGARPAPEVDFTRESAVAVLMGQKGNGCYAIRVTGVRAESDATVVTVTSYEPDPTRGCTQAITHPYHLVAIPLRDVPVRFEETRGVHPPAG